MLKQIECDYFKSSDKARGPIKLKKGLNTVRGAFSADNSIGKSTFLMAIDFCFGGESYKKQKFDEKIGNQVFKYIFEFDDQDYYFIRETADSNNVWECDSFFYKTNSIKLDDYKSFLKEKYMLSNIDMSFRDIVVRFMRIYGMETCSEVKPFKSYTGESDTKSLTALLKMFELYVSIKDFEDYFNESKAKKDVYQNARKYELVPNNITNNTARKNNQKRIEELDKEIEDLMVQYDSSLSDVDESNLEEISLLKGKFRQLKFERMRLRGRLEIVKSNIISDDTVDKEDFKELLEWFPTINFEKLKKIENYHRQLQVVLKDEFADEKKEIEKKLKQVDEDVERVQCKIKELGAPANIDTSFLNKLLQLKADRQMLEEQIKSFDKVKELEDDLKEKKKSLAEEKINKLKIVMDRINEEIYKMNEFIYEGIRYAPKLRIESPQRYTYETESDGGAGTAFKSLVILDLAILKLTSLPIIAHDSNLLKNIADKPLEKIFELYNQVEDKQIFVAFDKEKSYTYKTQEIIRNTEVIYLEENGNELFGYSWAKKEKDE